MQLSLSLDLIVALAIFSVILFWYLQVLIDGVRAIRRDLEQIKDLLDAQPLDGES